MKKKGKLKQNRVKEKGKKQQKRRKITTEVMYRKKK